MRVFVTHNPEDLEAYYARALPELRALDGVDVVLNPLDRDLTTPELIEASAGCQVIVAHRATPGETSLFDAQADLVAMLRCAVDLSTIDVDAASRNGILVARAGPAFIPSTAELALGLLLAVLRNIGESTHDYRQGELPPQRPGSQLRGKTAGIIGYGGIGRYLADLLHAMGVEVLVHDPYVDDFSDTVEAVSFYDLLQRSHIVFPLAESTPETEGMINAEALERMGDGTVLINVSRGELLDESAVTWALESGRLAGLGMDVGSAPDQRPNPSLAGHPSVVATPHLGGLTPENADAQAMSSVEQVGDMLDGEIPPRAVNADSADRLRAWWAHR